MSQHAPAPGYVLYGYATHHDQPMLFPTLAEAQQYCDDTEEPVPLWGLAPPETPED